MDTLTEIFNNRELAIIIWLVIIFIFVLSQKKTRSPLFQMLKILFSKKLLIINISMLLYIILLIYFLYKLSFWNISFLKDTIFWVLGVAFVVILNSNEATQTDNFFKKTIFSNIKLVVLLEFIMNLYTFNLAIEICLLPFLAFLVILNIFSEAKNEYMLVKKLLDNILSFIGLSIFAFSIFNIIKFHQDFDTIKSIHRFILTPVLTIGYLPFIYLVVLFMLYETLFVCINIFNNDDELKSYIKRKIFIKYHINLIKLKAFSKQANNLRFTSKDDINRILKQSC